MRTHKIFRGLMALLLLASAGQSVTAQEAFYVYRNDGDFNGFFYDQVKRMNLSKIDFDGVEHDDYVIQEIETEDSLYRIPLLAIDSIGFQQPEIIFNPNAYDMGSWESKYSYGGIVDDDPYTIYCYASYEENIPKPGQVLYNNLTWLKEPTYNYETYEYNDDGIRGPFVGRVKSVERVPGEDWRYYVHCEPVDNLSEVFEQLISVEQIGEYGNAYTRRMAGLDQVRTRASGNIDITFVNLEGHFPFSYEKDDFSATLSLDLSLKIQAQITYNITTASTFVDVLLKEDAAAGASFTVKATLEDATDWYLAGVPIYFPSVLPIFELDPSPRAFIKSSGDISLSLSTPKFGFKGYQWFHIGTDYVDGKSNIKPKSTADDDNGWAMALSMNGSIQGGSKFPANITTNTWAKNAIYAAVGADVYVGPKISASFSIDPVALAKGELYTALSSTNVAVTPIAVVSEGIAVYSIGKKKPTKKKFFEGSEEYLKMELKLFPGFETTEINTQPENNSTYGLVGATIHPRGNSVPYNVGVAAYNKDKQQVSKTYLSAEDNNTHLYAFFNPFATMPCRDIELLDGEYSIVPIIDAFGYDVPAWGSEIKVKRSLIPYWMSRPDDDDDDPTSGYILIGGLMPDDKVDFEKVSSFSTDCTYKVNYYKDPKDDRFIRFDILENSETTGSQGDVWFSKEGGKGLKDVLLTLGPDKSGTMLFQYHNNCDSWLTETGKYYKGTDITSTYNCPEGFSSQTYLKQEHYEACAYRVKVTRADGRSFYVGGEDSVIYFCGYGRMKYDGREAYYGFGRTPTGYQVDGNYIKN